MAARGRTDRGPGGASEEMHIWHTVRNQLKRLDDARGSAASAYERAGASGTTEGALDLVERSIREEQSAIDGAMEQIDILLALRQATSAAADGRRRKRKVDDGVDSGERDAQDAKARVADMRKTRGPGPKRTNGPQAGTDSALETLLAAQLPLKRGRKVAFRQPPRADGVAGDAGEVWILAKVINCVGNDPKQYVVQDAEDESAGGPTWQSSLSSIVPLPISVDTLPTEDYAPGARVLALYPDTSCFYGATVQGGGPGGGGASRFKKREHELLHAPYSLMFDDDGADIKQVPAYLIVERP
ncbi:hypothetical protein MSPP1_003418 [Malassezia sp. CBS 17886]|nr:hypothetical protein MSPP1_003418 [Malassezia sp. CBS 17886]